MGQRLIRQRVVLPFRGAWTGWRNRLVLWSSARGDVCPAAGEQLCGEGPLGGQHIEYEPAACKDSQ